MTGLNDIKKHSPIHSMILPESHRHWRWLPSNSTLSFPGQSFFSQLKGIWGPQHGTLRFLPKEKSSQLCGRWFYGFVGGFASRYKPHMCCLSFASSSLSLLLYTWRNLMFLVQQRNQNSSVTHNIIGEALSDTIHPRGVSCSCTQKSIYR